MAGGGRGLDHFPQISKLLRDAHIVCEPVFTEHKFHATELTVSAVKEGYRNIIVVGGDGTLHEVVNGLFIQQEVCPDEVLLAVIAVGTGNDWVRTFGISNRYQDAVKAIGEGYSFLQDVGVVSYEESHYRQSRYMANVAGAGFDARMVRKLSHLKKKGPQKPLALHVVSGQELLPLQVDGREGVGRRPAGLQQPAVQHRHRHL